MNIELSSYNAYRINFLMKVYEGMNNDNQSHVNFQE